MFLFPSKTPAESFKQHKTEYLSDKGYNISSSIVYKNGAYLRFHHHLYLFELITIIPSPAGTR
jgi:hypothetical protein